MKSLSLLLHITFRWSPVTACCILFLALSACQHQEKAQDTDALIAQLGRQRIYVPDLVRQGIDPGDSLAVAQYLDTWASDRLLAEEADKSISEEERKSIDRMVNDYRQMLYRNAYEKQLAISNADTVVTSQDIQSYYNQNKQKLSLDHKILRYRYIDVPKGKHPPKKILTLLKSRYPKDLETLRDWCRLNTANCMLNDTLWFRWSEVKPSLPGGIILNPSDVGKSVRIAKRGHQHFFYLAGYKNKGATPPLRYVENYLKKSILFERKKELIENRRKELYNKAIQQGKLRVHLGPETEK